MNKENKKLIKKIKKTEDILDKALDDIGTKIKDFDFSNLSEFTKSLIFNEEKIRGHKNEDEIIES